MYPSTPPNTSPIRICVVSEARYHRRGRDVWLTALASAIRSVGNPEIVFRCVHELQLNAWRCLQAAHFSSPPPHVSRGSHKILNLSTAIRLTLPRPETLFSESRPARFSRAQPPCPGTAPNRS